MRLDLYLVIQKLAASRTQAQDFISGGFVFSVVQNQKKLLTKASYEVKETDNIVVTENLLQKYVSRAGLKLEGALDYLNLNVKDKNILDIGQSTGGFTDCLLARTAGHVVGVDVGHSQLHEKIKFDPRVTFFENLNVKDLSSNINFLHSVPENKFNLVVADVSFISITKIIPSISSFLADNGDYLFLVKPQFECGKENLDSNGIVKEDSVYRIVEKEIREVCKKYFKNVLNYFESSLLGKDGNREFFIYGKNNSKF